MIPLLGDFVAFAERMATAGVRMPSRNELLEGLLSLVVNNYRTDAREVIKRICPLYHAAIRIGDDVLQLFEELPHILIQK
jgi:hypothetical protein